jgi:hypothetical protein
MKEPLTVKINVLVEDADGDEVYSAPHKWSKMSEAAEVEFMAALNNAVTDLGRAKASKNAQKPA